MSEQNQYPVGAAEYFRDFSNGRHDKAAYLTYIYPASECRFSEDGSAFIVGRAGVDGIEFAFLQKAAGIWAWYGIDEEWRQVAENLDDLDRRWRDGTLAL